MNQHDLASFLVFHHSWCTGHGVTGSVITKFFVPDDLASVLVQGHNPSIQRAKVNLVAINGSTTVDYVTTGTNIVRQTVTIAPQLLTSFGVQCPHARI